MSQRTELLDSQESGHSHTPEDSLHVRRATILDVPAVVRALPLPAVPLTGVSDQDMSRVLRLTLTHVAIEHGAAWIAEDAAGEIAAGAIAAPSWSMGTGNELPELLARETDLLPAREPEMPPLIDHLQTIGRAWLIAQPIAAANANDGELLRVAVEWAGERARADGVPLVVIAPDQAERIEAERLGFVEVPQEASGQGVWIGVRN